MEDLTGRQFGIYRIEALLGTGSMAAVYKAFQPGVERHVALKILPRDLAGDQTFMAHFRREARMLARLQHPHILPAFDYGEADGYAYIVMPLLSAGNLADRLKGRPLPLSQVQRVITQVGGALDYAHSQGVVHGNVKPGNVLVDERQNCLLADFGLARIYDTPASGVTGAAGVVGAAHYMSPEQIRGEALDRRSDIYSLGIILYEMVSGRRPFEGGGMSLALQIVSTAPQPPRAINPDLPQALQDVTLKALAKEPDGRFASAGEMVQAVQAPLKTASRRDSAGAAAAATMLDQAPAEGARASKDARGPGLSRWRLYGAGGGLLLVLALAVAIFLLRPAPQEPLAAASTASPTSQPIVVPPTPSPILTPTSTATSTSTPTPEPTPTSQPPASSSPIPTPYIADAYFCQQPCQADGSNSARTFPGGVTRIHTRWTYANIPVGAQYERIWTSNGEEYVRYACTWPGPQNGVDALQLFHTSGLRSGEWELTVRVDGEVLLQEQITLSGSADVWLPVGAFDSCYGSR